MNNKRNKNVDLKLWVGGEMVKFALGLKIVQHAFVWRYIFIGCSPRSEGNVGYIYFAFVKKLNLDGTTSNIGHNNYFSVVIQYRILVYVQLFIIANLWLIFFVRFKLYFIGAFSPNRLNDLSTDLSFVNRVYLTYIRNKIDCDRYLVY